MSRRTLFTLSLAIGVLNLLQCFFAGVNLVGGDTGMGNVIRLVLGGVVVVWAIVMMTLARPSTWGSSK
jgi:hypothetical protein